MDIIKFLQLGGAIMVPLLIVSVITVALIVDLSWINIRSHRKIRLLENNQPVGNSDDPVSKVINIDQPLDKKVDLLGYEIQKLERKTSQLSIIASISPLLGLLGTVFGMIKIFNVVSVEKPTNPLQSLSGGISEALVATAGGLILAIIAGFAHHLLISSLDSIGDKTLFHLNKNK